MCVQARMRVQNIASHIEGRNMIAKNDFNWDKEVLALKVCCIIFWISETVQIFSKA